MAQPLPKVERVGSLSALTICACFTAGVFWMHALAWTPQSTRLRGVAYVATSILIAVVVGATRRSWGRAAWAASGWVAALGFIQMICWLTPSSARSAFCGRPGVYCEDGILIVVYPIVALLGAIVAGALAGAIAALSGWVTRLT